MSAAIGWGCWFRCSDRRAEPCQRAKSRRAGGVLGGRIACLGNTGVARAAGSRGEGRGRRIEGAFDGRPARVARVRGGDRRGAAGRRGRGAAEHMGRHDHHMPPRSWRSGCRTKAWRTSRRTSRREVEYPPFAEYVIANSSVLVGGDRLANVPQWFAMFGSIVVGSLLAERLGGGSGQALAAIVFATVPTGILEATGAKNDCVVAFWLACATLSLLDLSRAGGRPWPDAVRFGWRSAWRWRRRRPSTSWGGRCWPCWRSRCWAAPAAVLAPLAVAGCVAIAMNVPHLWRDVPTCSGISSDPRPAITSCRTGGSPGG